MVESRDEYESFGDVEAMVRSAGEYVRASADLRPRVLETARLQNGERRARRHIGHSAVFASLLALFTTSAINRLETPDSFRQLAMVAATSHTYAGSSAKSGESGWALVEAYTELRRRQAEVLRLTL